MTGRKNNVVAFPGTAGPAIGSASVHSPGELLEGSRNEVWLCPAFSGQGPMMLYVKPKLTVPQMVAELVAAHAGQCIGVPCAPPFIVRAAPHHFGEPRGPAKLMFGCQQMGPSGLARPVRRLELMLDMLVKARQADGAALFDEWIANPVRSPGDMVFDPLGAVWLIDHEAALAAGVRADEAVINWLAARLIEGLDMRKRTDFLGRLRAKAIAAHRASLGPMPPELAEVPGGAETFRRLVQFLAARLEHLDRLLCVRVHPEQQYLTPTPATDDDSARTADL